MDPVFDEIGSNGKFQKLVLLLLGLLFALLSASMYFTVFTIAEPKLICTYANQTFDYNDTQVCDIWSYLRNSEEADAGNNSNTTKSNYSCYYDKEYYGKTIISEWNLVCDQRYLATLTQTIYMCGSFISLFFGFLGDYFGRRRTIVVFIAILPIILNVCEFLQFDFIAIETFYKYLIYCVNLFISGFICNYLYGTAFVLLMELTTAKHHTSFSIIALYAFTLGELIVLVVAYFFRNWHIYNWITAALSVLVFILITIFLPESPRWQISRKHHHEADITLAKIATINNRIYRRSYFRTEFHNLLSKKKLQELVDDDDTNLETFQNNGSRIHSICLPRKNAIKTVLLMYTFITLALVYYGISFGVTSIDGLNPYAVYLLSSIAELVGYTLSIVNEKLGRKKANILFLSLSAISCLFVGLTPSLIQARSRGMLSTYSILMLSLVAVSKCMVSAAFNNMWIYAAELYPTSTRSSAILLLNGISRIGALVAPFVILSGTVIWKHFPYFTFSGMSFLAAMFAFILPETFHD